MSDESTRSTVEENFKRAFGHYPRREAAVTPDPQTSELQLVALMLCDACLDGAGGECHGPGCALWMNRAPDLPLRDKVVAKLTVEMAS